MVRRFNRDDPEPARSQDEGTGDDATFALERTHERRILSWSPDPDDDVADEVVEAEVEETPAAVAAVPEPAPVVREEPAEPVRQTPTPTEARPSQPRPTAATEPRRRGRPRGRPRRQVHFHVDPDEELLLLEAAKKHGSQQKGLIAALQALQDNEILRNEIERLQAECERQRMLLDHAEALFKH